MHPKGQLKIATWDDRRESGWKFKSIPCTEEIVWIKNEATILEKDSILNCDSLSVDCNSDTYDGSDMEERDTYLPNIIDGQETDDAYKPKDMEMVGSYKDKLIWNFGVCF